MEPDDSTTKTRDVEFYRVARDLLHEDRRTLQRIKAELDEVVFTARLYVRHLQAGTRIYDDEDRAGLMHVPGELGRELFALITPDADATHSRLAILTTSATRQLAEARSTLYVSTAFDMDRLRRAAGAWALRHKLWSRLIRNESMTEEERRTCREFSPVSAALQYQHEAEMVYASVVQAETIAGSAVANAAMQTAVGKLQEDTPQVRITNKPYTGNRHRLLAYVDGAPTDFLKGWRTVFSTCLNALDDGRLGSPEGPVADRVRRGIEPHRGAAETLPHVGEVDRAGKAHQRSKKELPYPSRVPCRRRNRLRMSRVIDW